MKLKNKDCHLCTYLTGCIHLEEKWGAVMTRGDNSRGAHPNASQERQVAGLQLEDSHSPEKWTDRNWRTKWQLYEFWRCKTNHIDWNCKRSFTVGIFTRAFFSITINKYCGFDLEFNYQSVPGCIGHRDGGVMTDPGQLVAIAGEADGMNPTSSLTVKNTVKHEIV